ncbi:hypothetical protein ISF_01123 [Cordyceps fumosorosea ARSEF 2679]|uniref:DUF6546 domain-containing protein n=1 Tax=Cordyceps fumosorosea (strain ARSEF 2679) TaxID=1081104 RepID=A0A162JV81_CORFA|nr:hypothetical protein ISF_01123 [Cordyceps fumosorosea ARSEF 2679]OAA74222.1 hypothetical protein ISF_01123 [Cordyceps fumosorosea ARSEF 2679]
MSADTSTPESDAGPSTLPGTSTLERRKSKSPWLPVEIQIKIVDCLFDSITESKSNSRGEPVRELRPKKPAALGAAQVCYWWREKLEPLIYPNIFLTQHCVGVLRHLTPVQRDRVRYIKLAIEMEDQSCGSCLASSENDGKAAATVKGRGSKSPMALGRVQRRSDLRAAQAALECLFRCLSDWPWLHADGTSTGLRLEIGLVCRECATEHAIPDAGHLGTTTKCIDTNERLKLVPAPVVKELIMRQQSRYRIGPHIMAGIFKALPTVNSMLSIRHLALPEDLNTDHPRDLPVHHERDPRGLGGPEFCAFAFSVARRQLETLSVSHMIEADHFFSALDLEGWWPTLRSVHMTSRLMLPPSGPTENRLQQHIQKVNFMLRMVARRVLSYMPRIKRVVLWNGEVGAAGAFSFCVRRLGPEDENSGEGGEGLYATIGWRGTWPLVIDGKTIGAWNRLARSCTGGEPLGVEWPEMLEEGAIDSRSTAIRRLGLTEEVMDTASSEQVV